MDKEVVTVQATLGIGGRHGLSAPVVVDRHWAQTLGLHNVRGARRVGSFYQLPRSQYLKVVAAHSDAEIVDGLKWTDSDDRAVAELLETAESEAPCIECK